ncbi:MAG: glutamate--tRNA ligase, partial [Alphaproteobacteria bacterium]|nr:glutamate--tRNA ligase [Alphaproteobacteria bacterium]
HYRFKMNDSDITWNDMVKGELKFAGNNISDPIVIREDNSMTYILCSVVDDIDFNITHILRGEDHVSNTAVQIQMFEALQSKHPQFGHTALIKSKEQEISKRLGGFDIKTLREKGIEPMAIASMFAKIGTSDAIEPFLTMDDLTASFDISKFGKAPANYDENELFELNRKLVGIMPYAQAESRLNNLGVKCSTFWDGVKGNLDKVDDIKYWWDMCVNPITPVLENNELLSTAIKLAPEGNWNLDTWGAWTKAISNESGLKCKALFMPLRKALTGLEHGPEIKYLLPVIGREKALKRLNGETA